MKHFTLAAFSAERRHAAIAIFQGTRLDDIHLRYLPSDSSKAIGSVNQMTIKILEQVRPEFVAIRTPAIRVGNRTRQMYQSVREIAERAGIPIVDVDDVMLMCAYGHPPLTRRDQVQRVAQTIWPVFHQPQTRAAALDAAVTGLYVQTERLFAMHEAAT